MTRERGKGIFLRGYGLPILMILVSIAGIAYAEREPLRDPLSNRQISNRLFEHVGEGFSPVHHEGDAVFLLHDLDGNGYTDVFALVVQVESIEEAAYSRISDYVRLYESERKITDFFIQLFFQREGDLHFGGMHLTPVHATSGVLGLVHAHA